MRHLKLAWLYLRREYYIAQLVWNEFKTLVLTLLYK